MTLGYGARIRRAEHLKTVYSFAAEILTYYGRVCKAQEDLSGELQHFMPRQTSHGLGDLRELIDVGLLLPFAGRVLGNLEEHPPAPLAAFIGEFLNRSEAQKAAALQEYKARGGTDDAPQDARERLVAAILVQPYAELLAAKTKVSSPTISGNLCPQCAARPLAGVLRVEGDGGKRFLLCSFCGNEWEFRRILCAYCGETREESLPVYVAEKFPHLRIEACDTCRHCLRTVDLTKDGNAIPVVDDLAAIPLALWAEENGYQRIHSNLLGT